MNSIGNTGCGMYQTQGRDVEISAKSTSVQNRIEGSDACRKNLPCP